MERRPEGRRNEASEAAQIWAIRFFLDREGGMRGRALFDIAIDSKLRGCDLVKIKIGTLVTGQERSEPAPWLSTRNQDVLYSSRSRRTSGQVCLRGVNGEAAVDDFAFPSRIDHADHLSTRQLSGSLQGAGNR